MSAGAQPGRAGSGRVVVVGSVNADFVTVVEHLPRPGETVIGGVFERHWGGKGANQAVAARRFGADVCFVGAVGDDDLGAAAVEALEADGVDASGVARLPGQSTGVALIVVDVSGQNQIAVASGANLSVDAAGLDALLRGGALGVVLTNFEVPDVAVVEAVRAAQAAGWVAVVNPAPARPIPEELRGSGVILTPNEHELESITGDGTPEDAACSAVEVTGGSVAVTLGADGALLLDDGAVTRVYAPEVTSRDTTGAGDVFNGVLAAALAEGRPLADGVRLAVCAASFAVEIPGARGQLHRAELERRLADAPSRSRHLGRPGTRRGHADG